MINQWILGHLQINQNCRSFSDSFDSFLGQPYVVGRIPLNQKHAWCMLVVYIYD